jgi:hypothetical protein
LEGPIGRLAVPGLFGKLGELGLDQVHEGGEGGRGEGEFEVGGGEELGEGIKDLARSDVRDIFGIG